MKEKRINLADFKYAKLKTLIETYSHFSDGKNECIGFEYKPINN
jgi:hypothetical protein